MAVTYLRNANATFINCTFINNKSTRLETLNRVLSFVGNTTFRGNIAHSNGGGMLLTESYMLLDRNVQLYFIDNHASYGGAIYIVPMAQGDCFFELKSFETQNQEVDAVIQFENNTANLGGDVLYGGNVDTCLLHQTPHHNALGRFQWLLADPEQILLGSELFNLSFNYSDQSGFSVISSHPNAVCLCDSGEPRCSIKSITLQVVPGEPFAVLAVLGTCWSEEWGDTRYCACLPPEHAFHWSFPEGAFSTGIYKLLNTHIHCCLSKQLWNDNPF